MPASTLAVSVIIFGAAALLVIAWRMRERLHVGEDFSLARRRLPARLCGLSQFANCLPVWFLLALAAYAHAVGLAAAWLAVACLLGMLVNWWFVAPRLRAMGGGVHTLSQWFGFGAGERMQTATLRSAAVIVVVTLGLATTTLLQWSAVWLGAAAEISVPAAIVLIAGVLFVLLILGGLWAAAVCDAAVAVLVIGILAVAALAAVFSADTFGVTVAERTADTWFAGYEGVLATALLVGAFFAAFGSAAQPQMVSRYWACKDGELQSARRLALLCGVLGLGLALFVGWSARPFDFVGAQGRVLLLGLFERLLPPFARELMLAGLAIAVAASCVSPCVAIATHLAADLRATQRAVSLAWCRSAAALVVLFVGIGAWYLPVGDEGRLWFCWQAVSSAFGPLMLVRLSGKRVRSGSSLGAMWAGFVLTVVFHLMPDTPGDLLERSLPFIAGMGIALSGGERRRNPDRADRGDRTVYDHLPI